MSKTWETLQRRTIYERRPWLVLREDHVRLPSGLEIPDFIQTIEPDVAMVFAVTTEETVPLVSQYRYGISQELLDLPAGYVDPDEDHFLAAQRELEEETGYSGGVWSHLGSFWRNSTRGPQRIHIYLAQGVQPGGVRHLDVTEDLDVCLTPLTELPSLIHSGRLSGTSSVAGALLALRSLDR